MSVSKTVVYIDGSAFTAHPSGGVAHYAHELCQKLSTRSDLELIVVLFKGECIDKDMGNITIINLPFPRKIYSFAWKYILQIPVNAFLPHDRIDVALYLNFAPSPTINAKRTVSFVHDLAFMHVPETVEARNRQFLKMAIKSSVRRSDVIGFPSIFTRDDFLSRFNFTGDVFVAYPGYSRPDPTTNTPLVDTPDNFLLNIGTLEPRKNIAALCNAFLESSFYKQGWSLLLAGKKGWGDVALPDSDKIIHIDTPSDAERDSLLGRCRAFVFPSLFEGFGMPVIEAMYQNKPVISTNNSSLAEIANIDNSYIIDSPPVSGSILEQMERLNTDLIRRANLVNQKTTRAANDVKKFTWDSCSEIIYDAIKGTK